MIVYDSNHINVYYLVKNNETENEIIENIKKELYENRSLSHLKENVDQSLYKLTFYDKNDISFKSEILVVDNYC
jgi:hypothetical protein